MQTKTQPSQDRSRQTYEAVLSAAASLLEEVGIESLSTNLICARANLTPPALYRYFPNKYALLRELGIRLMQVQDQAVFDWIDAGGLDSPSAEESFRRDLELTRKVVDLTRAQPAALWIARAMRAVPMLREVRVQSRERVADVLFNAMRPRLPNVTDELLRRSIRLNIELSSAAIEMILEEPDAQTDELIAVFTMMMSSYFSRFA